MGRATALTFAREGARVVGCDVSVESASAIVEMVRAAGGEMVSLHPCQLGDPAECTKLVVQPCWLSGQESRRRRQARLRDAR